ncbi:MAG: hypothetical protein EBR60_02195 [Burkholderiaceae bacterium]|nr:hypothetical protein [Burkholderiaceae bacterium]
MATLVEFRAQNPEYNDMPDLALADALHSKYYADIPRGKFFEQLGVSSAQIPGAERSTTLPPTPVSMQDRVMGLVETPAIIAGQVGQMVATPLAKMFGEAYGGYGTPQGKEMGQKAAQVTSQQFYQPRTETGPDIVNAMGKALNAIPPTPLSSAGTALSTLAGPALSQARNIVAPAVITTQQRMAALLQPKNPQMTGMGAASTDQALIRQERALQQGIPLTKGEQLQDFGLLKRESDLPKENPDLAKALTEFKQRQKQDILKRFEQLADQTGAEYADPTAYRKIGSLVDTQIVKQFDAKKLKVDEAYQAARDAGETKQVVDTAPLEQWLANNAPEAISVPEINSIKAKLEALKTTTNGQVTIDDVENLYKAAGQLGEPGKPSGVFMRQVKNVINDMTEGAGGDMYRAARTQRKELANEFENTYRVAKLLGTKGGYTDRAVALDDVFSHVVLDGSLEEMRTVTKLLKKGGPEGQQAYAELQGQTVQYLKDQLTKNASGELSFAKLKSAIDTLDREDKLTYMFGKKGRENLIDLRDTVQDALVKPQGAVNYSNTGSVVMRGLDQLAAIRFPLAKTAADIAKTREISKQVQESTKYNALVDALKGTK